MFKKILVAVDGSQNAERALPWLKLYAAPSKAEVVLFRAVPEHPPEKRTAEERLKEARTYLMKLERELNRESIPTKILAQTGNAPAAIVRAAEEEGCGLIMMTTRGGSKTARWLVGGTTEQTLRLSHVPVFVIRSQTAPPRQLRVSRIIVPLDGSALAESILPWAEQLARSYRARIDFLHVYPRGPVALSRRYDEMYDALRKRIVRTCESLRTRGVRASFRVDRGDVASAILKGVGRGDIIATTSHGFGGFKRWIFGSVAEKIVHASEVPVFVYRAAEGARLARAKVV